MNIRTYILLLVPRSVISPTRASTSEKLSSYRARLGFRAYTTPVWLFDGAVVYQVDRLNV